VGNCPLLLRVFIMEMIKLINAKGDIIERKKIDYEPNVKIWGQRGWKLYEEKAVTKPEVVLETIIKENIEEVLEVVTEMPTNKPKKKSKKKAR
jgi:hypothetical protein|tara:strand:- start:107 stop:385 length:279 start_codon:yes stop_codon:yes gene_type:complete